MKKIIISIAVLMFLGCEITDSGRPEAENSTGTYYTQTADVTFIVSYSDGSSSTIIETITDTRTPMQGIFRHSMVVDGKKFYNIEVDFEDYRLLGTWDNTVDNITFGSGAWDTVQLKGIYLNGAGPYYYGFTYTDPDVFIKIDTTVDLKKM